MKRYPSIPRSVRSFRAYVFDKIDGSNLRFEWDEKKGWFRFGTRHKVIDASHPVFGGAQSIFEARFADELEKIARENRASRILKVHLKIGRLSGIITDSLMFAFEAMKHEHPLLLSAEIVINEIPLVYECNECNHTFETEDIYFPDCPKCKSCNLNIISGEEQHIENVEVEI